MKTFIILVGFLSLPVTLFSQNSIEFGSDSSNSIIGFCQDQKAHPIPGVVVWLDSLINSSVQTDPKGKFKLLNFSSGIHILHFKHLAFETTTIKIELPFLKPLPPVILLDHQIHLDEVVVEGQHKLETLHSFHGEEWGRENLDNENGNSVMSSLVKRPGIQQISSGLMVSKPVVRGQSFNRVLFIDQGVRQEGQQWGADHGLEIDPFSTFSIKQIQNTMALKYASAPSGGILYSDPNPPPSLNSWAGSGFLSGRSNNQNLLGALNLAINTKGLYAQLGISGGLGSDFRVPVDSHKIDSVVVPLKDNLVYNTAMNYNNISGIVGLHKKWGHISASVNRNNQKVGFYPLLIDPEVEPMPSKSAGEIILPNQNILHEKYMIRGQFPLGKSWLEILASYQENQRLESSEPHQHAGEAPVNSTEALNLWLRTSSLKMVFEHPATGKNKIFAGIEGIHQKNNSDGFEHLLPNFESWKLSGFLIGESRLNSGPFVVRGGLRSEIIRYDISETIWSEVDSSGGIETLVLNPKIQKALAGISASGDLVWNISPKSSFSWTLGYGFRNPEPAELANNGFHHAAFRYEVGDKDLGMETNFQTQLGFHHTSKKTSLLVRGFATRFWDYIFPLRIDSSKNIPDEILHELEEEGTSLTKYSLTDAYSIGGEINFDYHIIRSLHIGLGMDIVRTLDLAGNNLPFVPPARIMANIKYNKNLSKKILSLYGLGVKRVFDQDHPSTFEKSTPGYWWWDLMLGLNIKSGNREVQFRFRIENLFDQAFFDHLDRYRVLNITGSGRNFILSMRIPFGGDF